MTDQDRQDFDQMIIDFCKTMGLGILSSTYFWWSTLEPYEFSEVKRALEDSARDYSNLKQKPTPAEIRMLIEQDKRKRNHKAENFIPEKVVPPPQEFIDAIKNILTAKELFKKLPSRNDIDCESPEIKNDPLLQKFYNERIKKSK